MANTLTQNPDGSLTFTDQDGNAGTYKLGVVESDPTRGQLVAVSKEGVEAPVAVLSMASAGRLEALRKNVGGSAFVLTEPGTGFITWAG
jgi:hypothetical protein